MAGKLQGKRDGRRDAARAAVKRAAVANRRKHMLSVVLAGVASLGLIAAAIAVFGVLNDDDGEVTAAPSNSTGPAEFPPVPKGADKALKTKPKVSAGSGDLTKLVVTTIVQGKGEAAQSGKLVTVNYVGVSYKTGQEFDSSWTRQEPAQFQLGTGQLIDGFEQGLMGVKLGSRVQLDIPANMAYGEENANTANGAPSGPLRFVVDVLNVQSA